jgi:hypothetical protein
VVEHWIDALNSIPNSIPSIKKKKERKKEARHKKSHAIKLYLYEIFRKGETTDPSADQQFPGAGG